MKGMRYFGSVVKLKCILSFWENCNFCFFLIFVIGGESCDWISDIFNVDVMIVFDWWLLGSGFYLLFLN